MINPFLDVLPYVGGDLDQKLKNLLKGEAMNNYWYKFSLVSRFISHSVSKALVLVFALFAHGALVAYEVGSLPGSFSVSPTGSATYTIPIEVPKGVNGMQPDLAFACDSHADNGLMEQGWALAGMSYIFSCGQILLHCNVEDQG